MDKINESYKRIVEGYGASAVKDMLSPLNSARFNVIKETDDEFHFKLAFLGNTIEYYSYEEAGANPITAKESGYIKVNGKDITSKLPKGITSSDRRLEVIPAIINSGSLS